MKTQNKFWWFVVVALTATAMVLLTISILFWQQLSLEEKALILKIFKRYFAYLFTILFLFFTFLGFLLDWIFRFYIIPVNQLADETRLLYTVNPSHKIDVDGSYDVMRLAAIINENAIAQVEFRNNVQEQLRKARAGSEAERNVLAAMLEDLPQGILVCNMEGGIVFYNRKISALFRQHQLAESQFSTDEVGLIGLGRTVYAFLDKGLVLPALDRIAEKLSLGHTAVSERFLLETQSKALLPAQILPVLDSQHHLSGFILYIEDQVEQLKKEREFSTLLLSWQHELTQAVSVIKSTAELLVDESEGVSDQIRMLIQLLDKQANLAAALLSRQDITNRWSPDQPLPLTPVDAMEWARFLAFRAEHVLQLRLHIETVGGVDQVGQVSVDMHHLTCALLYVLANVQQTVNMTHIDGVLYAKGSWIYLDLSWEGAAIEPALLARWKQGVSKIQGSETTIPLTEMLVVHGAKLWVLSEDQAPGISGLRFLIPMLDSADIVMVDGLTTVLPDSRPEFYDFDLFKGNLQYTDFNDRLLTDLTFTVFDTETTGLDPQGGDEIISIGAVRIVNGRLLQGEKFEQLVNPGRSLPWASVKFHGIRPEMLVNQPTIDKVLPRFHSFVRDTVLVGHNVAFDMRMLQMKENQTHICFTNPILDTMLLSDVVHPAHPKHSLQAVAERLGIRIMGRHTALGDAIATGEIFLRLIPLLAAQGIRTFQEASQASQKSLYARLKY